MGSLSVLSFNRKSCNNLFKECKLEERFNIRENAVPNFTASKFYLESIGVRRAKYTGDST